MTEFMELVGNPYFWGLVAAYWAFNAFVDALPTLEEVEAATGQPASLRYRFARRMLNTLAGNVRSAFQSRIPGSDGK